LLPAQANPAKRLSSIVGVRRRGVRKAIDEHGQLISKDEFERERYGFLTRRQNKSQPA